MLISLNIYFYDVLIKKQCLLLTSTESAKL